MFWRKKILSLEETRKKLYKTRKVAKSFFLANSRFHSRSSWVFKLKGSRFSNEVSLHCSLNILDTSFKHIPAGFDLFWLIIRVSSQAVHICDDQSCIHIILRSSNIGSFIYSLALFTFDGYITNSQRDELPVALIAQSVSQRSWARIPFRPGFFFIRF